ncbi:polysaccharide deacetylase family protein [Pseudonocardia xinjiangensis]|uniref:polysaccharide deacetylase family protein n=1 Tax=Pseudonocardia xinjiangensis TaxID=75289 RepID=UPI003D8FFD13
MLFAGIAWTGRGLDVAFRDASSAPVGSPVHFPAGQVSALADFLRDRDRELGAGVTCVVDSTNGMVDGWLMAAGLRVLRADPRTLPQRPALGSVDADTLARLAASRGADLTPLVLASGSLTGRSADQELSSRASEADVAALAARGRWVTAGVRDEEEPVVALTFDDGPNPPVTGRVLDVLARYGVQATFFCVGMHAAAHPEFLARMTEAGHALGNHTWSHPFLPDLSQRELEVQLERTDDAIESAAGARPVRMFRPPYGSRSPDVVSWLGRDGGPTVVLWDVDTDDWARPGAPSITATVLAQVRPGSIVLMHDGGGDRSQTVESLPAVIEGLLDRGYRFARADDLVGHGLPG